MPRLPPWYTQGSAFPSDLIKHTLCRGPPVCLLPPVLPVPRMLPAAATVVSRFEVAQ